MMLGCLFFFFTKMFSWKCHHDISDIIRSLVGARKEMNIQQKTNENNNTIDSKYFRFLVFLHFSCCHQITTNNNCNNDVFVGTATTMSTSPDIKSLTKENVPLSQEKKNKKKNLHFLYPGKAPSSKAYFKYSATELSSAKQGQVAPLVKYTSLIATFYI